MCVLGATEYYLGNEIAHKLPAENNLLADTAKHLPANTLPLGGAHPAAPGHR